jgi:hypothetical protein
VLEADGGATGGLLLVGCSQLQAAGGSLEADGADICRQPALATDDGEIARP